MAALVDNGDCAILIGAVSWDKVAVRGTQATFPWRGDFARHDTLRRNFAPMSTPSADPWFQTLLRSAWAARTTAKARRFTSSRKSNAPSAAVLQAHPERQLLDFGIGENDDMADPLVRETLKREVEKIENRGYADNGLQSFKDAAAAFMKKQFGVQIDPLTEVNHAIGSKPALAMLPAAFINPGDVTLMTVPGYPVAGTHTKYYGGEVYNLPLLEQNGFYPDLAAIPADIRKRAKLMVINYPNSPTGAVATRDFYRQVIDFALTNRIVVVQDAAHILLSYDGPPLSFLQLDGAKEVGVEIHSMSKGFNMIGWRMAFVVGHPKIVQAFADVKDNSDSGQFAAVQQASRAGVAAHGNRRPGAGEISTPAAETGGGAESGWLPGENAGRHLFPVRRRSERLWRAQFRQCGRRVAILDSGAVGAVRAVGQCRPLPAVLGDLPGER